MLDATHLVGNTAVVCTIASNFAGLPSCVSMVRQKSTSGSSVLPFLSAAACTTLWLQYGVLIGDGAVAAVNLTAAVLQCCYLGCFYYATSNKAALLRWLACCVFLLFSVHVYAFYLADRESAMRVVGLLSCCGSVAACAAPLAGLGSVLRTRSTRCLPLPIIASSFVVTSLWYAYGILVGDTFIQVPNVIGATLSGFQLSLFVVFGSREPRFKTE